MTNPPNRPPLRYDEGCLGAHALNFIGDRWALLVMRELMFQPKRFQMLRAGLPGITASVLTQRLGQLTQSGVVVHDTVLGTYGATDAGRALAPVLRELCRWALLMPGHDHRKFISISALMISMTATVDPARAAGSTLRAGFLSGHEGYEMTFSPQGTPQITARREPGGDFVMTANGNALAMAIYGPDLASLASAGGIDLRGDMAAAQEFAACFSLSPQISAKSESPEVRLHVPGDSST